MSAWRESLLRETTAKREAEHSEFKINPDTCGPKEWGEVHVSYLRKIMKGSMIRPLPYDKTKPAAKPDYDEAELLAKLPPAKGMFEDLNVDVMKL